MSWSFAPYALIRIAGMPYQAAAELRTPAAIAGADRLRELRDVRRARGAALGQRLYELVPGAASGEVRAALLSIQRALHNDRPLDAHHVATVAAWAGDEISRCLKDMTGLWAKVDAAECEFALCCAAEHRAVQRHLQVLAEDPDLLRAAQLSNPALVHNLRRYAAADDLNDKRSRTTELSLVNYVSRMATKPSPFSSFARTQLAVSGGSSSGSSSAGQPIRVARLARMVGMWVQRSAADHPALRPYSWVRPANTLQVAGDTASWLRRGMDGSTLPAAAERAASLTLRPPMRVLLERIAAMGVLRHHKIAARCGADPGWAALLDKMIEAGMLECYLGGHDQSPDLLGELAAELAVLPVPVAADLAAAVGQLRDFEQRFAAAGIDERTRITSATAGLLQDIAALLGIQAPELVRARTLYYEDVAESATAPFPAQWQSFIKPLGVLQRFLSVFDDGLHPKLQLTDMFLAQFGAEGYPTLLDMYHWFCRIPAAEIQGRMVDITGKETVLLRKQQNKILDRLREMAQAATGDIVLDPEELLSHTAHYPRFVAEPQSVSWFGQFADGTRPGDSLLVLNQGGTGLGKQFSRFCGLFEAGSSLADMISAQVATAEKTLGGRVIDLMAVLGMNVNLHPALYSGQLEYPGSRADNAAAETFALGDIRVRYDPRCHRLVTERQSDGGTEQLLLTPLNFLLPDLGPPLYRFLNLLSHEPMLTVGLWERVDQRGPQEQSESIRSYPRMLLDRVVLDRRTWKIPRRALLTVPSGTTADIVRAVRDWQLELGLPDQVFCRSATLPDPLASARRQRERWQEVLSIRGGATRKPQYVDFTSIPLVLSFVKLVRRVHSELTVQEFLPGTETLREGTGNVRELLVELYREAADGR